MAREQSEYDRLVSGTTDTTVESDRLDIKSFEDSKRELLRTTVGRTSTVEPQSMLNIPNYLRNLACK